MARIRISFGSPRKRRREKEERVFGFESFCKPGVPARFDGCFQENMRTLLGFGHREDVVHAGFKCWSFLLEIHRSALSDVKKLFVVEEMVGLSPHRRCRYCRSVGIAARF
ncbi:hypothetical protein HPP92_009317 [Vanilla planifolia]|uniref:Uncharacterized protein n=1 Tax=Vanilla planifolia TaxID=51239 RepID=A0A835RF18_VANPL|nr:hypothetical protein HPP92_009317 [Vanilla planifolia]